MRGRSVVAVALVSVVSWIGCHGQTCPAGAGGGPGALVCQGERYDVNGSPADGCEVPDSVANNHDQSHALALGTVSACDMNGTVGFHLRGLLPSDKRCHEPPIDGFDPETGSAPDWLSITGAGHVFCENDLVATLQIDGSQSPSCYRFAVHTGRNDYECNTDATGSCGFDFDTGSQFFDGATIYFEVSKTCGTNVVEAPSYRIFGHL